MKRILFFVASLAFVSACVSSSGGSSGKYTAQLGGDTISWSDMLVSDTLKAMHADTVVQLKPGESVYLFSATRASDLASKNNMPSVLLSDGSTIRGDIRTCELILYRRQRAKEISLYEECRAKMKHMPLYNAAAHKPVALPLSRLISDAERAVRASGSCQWLGYDKKLDARMRARGALASSTDTRLFFAKLRCGG